MARVSTNGRDSGRSRSSPSNVARDISWPYTLCTALCGAGTPSLSNRTSSGIVPVGVSNTAGSFMSFQMPATPMSSSRAYSDPHHVRVAGRVKSGNTLGPGLRSPRDGHTGAS